MGLWGFAGTQTIAVPWLLWLAFASIVVDHVYGWHLEHRPERVTNVARPLRVLAYSAAVLFLFNALPEHVNPYVYFQF